MSKRFLVTTAIEETIPQNEPILFLGEWCRPFKNINKLGKKILIITYKKIEKFI